jgi:hypothetical protein
MDELYQRRRCNARRPGHQGLRPNRPRVPRLSRPRPNRRRRPTVPPRRRPRPRRQKSTRSRTRTPLIAQFFGLADADLSEFTRRGAARSAGRGPVARPVDQGDPRPRPANPAAPAKALQTQQHSAPATPFDLKPLLKGFQATDPELCACRESHAGRSWITLPRHLLDLASLGRSSARSRSGHRRPSFSRGRRSSVLRQPAPERARLEGHPRRTGRCPDQGSGVQDRRAIVQANPGMDHGQARRWASCRPARSRSPGSPWKSVQGQITKRSKSITPPGTAASRGAAETARPADDPRGMLAAVARTAEANGMELEGLQLTAAGRQKQRAPAAKDRKWPVD